MTNELIPSDILLQDICQIITSTKQRVAARVNSELTLMYWHIGHRINTDVLDNKRAEYGKQIVSALSVQLINQFGSNEYSVRSLRRMMQFAQEFPDLKIVSPLATQLSWTHFVEVLPIKDDLQREFYITMAASERWSKWTLRKKVDDMLYERTLISQKPDEFVKHELSKLREDNVLSPDIVFKSPYFLDFTGLKGYYSERNLEDMLLVGLQQFLMELGNGFTFVERQKRMIIDGEDFYLDLLFYHRKLHRLIAIELKRGRFKAAYKGQMELYLRWLDKYERQSGEETPLGLLLCSEGSDEQIELLQLDEAGIKVAQYYTELPDKALLKEQIRKQLALAKTRIENREEDNTTNIHEYRRL
jgi:predicted nuclease of restriction endonuclease-like (RecB) superfamily